MIHVCKNEESYVCENKILRSCKYNIILFNKKNNIIRYFTFMKMKHFVLVSIILFSLIRRIILYDASRL